MHVYVFGCVCEKEKMFKCDLRHLVPSVKTLISLRPFHFLSLEAVVVWNNASIDLANRTKFQC